MLYYYVTYGCKGTKDREGEFFDVSNKNGSSAVAGNLLRKEQTLFNNVMMVMSKGLHISGINV